MTVRSQLLVPSANREEVLKTLYDSAHGGGHYAENNTNSAAKLETSYHKYI